MCQCANLLIGSVGSELRSDRTFNQLFFSCSSATVVAKNYLRFAPRRRSKQIIGLVISAECSVSIRMMDWCYILRSTLNRLRSEQITGTLAH